MTHPTNITRGIIPVRVKIVVVVQNRSRRRSKIIIAFRGRLIFSRRPLSFDVDVSWDNDGTASGKKGLVVMRGREDARKKIGGNRVFRECCSSKGIR